MTTADFLVIGGGVIGVNIARSLKRTFADAKVILIEKEKACGLHASTRNSGVLHAGFYYSPDSLKARLTRTGNQALTAYCESHRIPVNKCGKLVVAQNPGEHAQLDELLNRGRKNGIDLQDISEEEAMAIEPRVKTCGRALFSPTTSSVDPQDVLHHMVQDALREGVVIHTGVRFETRVNSTLCTSAGHYQGGYVVNAAGLYADKIARSFGFSSKYRILPFKGLYLYSDEPAGAIRTNIYPVPNLRNPFLGVHFTVTSTGKIKIGPTAIPAFWRENYQGLEGFNLQESCDILAREASLFGYSQFEFKKLALEEVRKYSRPYMVSLASSLAEGIRPEYYRHWGKPGIRAQLFDVTTHRLEMDFVLEGDRQSMHVLNAVSPAFTCSIPFSHYVCEQIQAKLH